MRRFLADPLRCITVAGLLLLAISASEFPILWLASFGAFFLSVFVLGWHEARPVLVWIIAINMLSIWADVLLFELTQRGLVAISAQFHQEEAIYYSACALLFLAIGMRLGLQIGAGLVVQRLSLNGHATAAMPWSAPRIAYAYFGFTALTLVFGAVAAAVPGLSQPLHALTLLKFVLIYWLSATIFASNRHYIWLAVVLAAELVIGSTGFWASFKEGFFVVLLALAGSYRRLSARQFGFALAGCALIVYMSLVWTAVKDEYRRQVAGQSATTSISWLAGKYFGGGIEIPTAAISLLERIGYTKFYALVLAANTDSVQGIYGRAVLHIFTPRMLFPEKEILDDSKQTMTVIGWNIKEGTSIGLGYVAQAHIDFGFPGLLLPMVALGALIGLIYWYFRTRSAPAMLCEAFAVGCLFRSLAFEGNIDKQLGGMVMTLLVFALVLRFGTAAVLRLVWRKQELHQVFRHEAYDVQVGKRAAK